MKKQESIQLILLILSKKKRVLEINLVDPVNPVGKKVVVLVVAC